MWVMCQLKSWPGKSLYILVYYDLMKENEQKLNSATMAVYYRSIIDVFSSVNTVKGLKMIVHGNQRCGRLG